jgi:hypothetical protein
MVQDLDCDGDLSVPLIFVRNRRLSPMTRFQRLKNTSIKARMLYWECLLPGHASTLGDVPQPDRGKITWLGDLPSRLGQAIIYLG